MRVGPLRSISALLFTSALLAAPLPAQNDTPLSPTDPAVASPATGTTISPLRRIGGGVSSPIVVHTVTPQFSEQARKEKVGGTVLVNLIVDAHGQPQNVHILRGVGMGLDEQALIAVKQYRFKPAIEGGKPVPVELNVEVNFQIFDGPKVLHSVPLEISDDLRQAHAGETVVVALTVDIHGMPQNVHVVRAVGMGVDQHAVEAVRQYRFEPFIEGGQPVAKATTIQVRIDPK